MQICFPRFWDFWAISWISCLGIFSHFKSVFNSSSYFSSAFRLHVLYTLYLDSNILYPKAPVLLVPQSTTASSTRTSSSTGTIPAKLRSVFNYEFGSVEGESEGAKSCDVLLGVWSETATIVCANQCHNAARILRLPCVQFVFTFVKVDFCQNSMAEENVLRSHCESRHSVWVLGGGELLWKHWEIFHVV